MNHLHVSKTDKIILGVCGGIAETYNIDPTLVRIGVAILCIITGIIPVSVGYLIAWIIMPKGTKTAVSQTPPGAPS